MADVERSLLVVDDEPYAARALARAMRRFRVEVAYDRGEAMEAAARRTHDAFLLDVHLGLRDPRGGILLAGEVRVLRPQAVVVLLSGFEVEELQPEARRAKADLLLQKGDVKTTALARHVGMLIERRAGPRPSSPAESPPDRLIPWIDAVLDANGEEQDARCKKDCRLIELAREAAASTGGASSLDAAARAVGLARPTLLGYAKVASRWTAAELDVLLCDRHNGKGRPISIFPPRGNRRREAEPRGARRPRRADVAGVAHRRPSARDRGARSLRRRACGQRRAVAGARVGGGSGARRAERPGRRWTIVGRSDNRPPRPSTRSTDPIRLARTSHGSSRSKWTALSSRTGSTSPARRH